MPKRHELEEPAMKTKSVKTGSGGFNVTSAKYEPVREAIMSALPRSKTGMTFNDLVASIESKLPKELFPKPGSVAWYTKVVQLDLEAKGLIERIPGAKPQRIRRTK
jgi:hypothetical protein